MQLKVTELRQRLAAALRTEFERAQEQSATRIAHCGRSLQTVCQSRRQPLA